MDPLERHYKAAAYGAVTSRPGMIQAMAPIEICDTAADAAVLADRHRMAEQLRNRIINRPAAVDVPESEGDLVMKLDQVMFDLADQIEKGMPFQTAEDGS